MIERETYIDQFIDNDMHVLPLQDRTDDGGRRETHHTQHVAAGNDHRVLRLQSGAELPSVSQITPEAPDFGSDQGH